MPSFRYRDDDDSSSRGLIFLAAGALVGVGVGVWLAQRAGGFSALSARVRERFGATEADDEQAYEGAAEDDDYESNDADVLEERVLEAFRNDPVLAERAVDIGAVSTGIIELTGWVRDEDESEHAVTLTRGVPGVDTVVNRLSIRDEERERADAARRYASGDPALTESRWEGHRVGTGRRRQGTSQEPGRHSSPRTELEEKWTDEQHSIEDAAGDLEGVAERRSKRKAAREGDRTGGAPVAPTGVPKGDHVAEPASAETAEVLREKTGRETRRAD